MAGRTGRLSLPGVVPPLPEPGEPRVYEDTQRSLQNEQYFDRMMKRCNSMAVHRAFEPLLRHMFQADRAIVWLTRYAHDDFHSPTLNRVIKSEDSLVHAVSVARTAFNCAFVNDRSALDELCAEPRAPQLLFPLYLRTGPLIGVCQVSRGAAGAPFAEREMQQAYFVTRKFVVYGTCTLNTARTVTFASDLSRIAPPDAAVAHLTASLAAIFRCASVDFWTYRPATNAFAQYVAGRGSVLRPPARVGIVSHALRALQFVNERARKHHVNFVPDADGAGDDPILVGAGEFGGLVYAVALRGRTNGLPFSIDDEKRMETVMPFLSRSLSYSLGFAEHAEAPANTTTGHLIHLLDAACRLTPILEMDELKREVESQGKALVGADFCELVLKPESDIPLNVVSSQQPFLGDESAHDEKLFGKQPVKAVLAVPVFSAFDAVLAVLVVAHRHAGAAFTSLDQDRIIAFAVFCGISLQNVLVTERARRVLAYGNSGNWPAITDEESVRKLLARVFAEGGNLMGMTHLTLFAVSESKLFEWIVIGERVNATDSAQFALTKRELTTFVIAKETAIPQHSSLWTARPADAIVCSAPLVGSDGKIVGILEFGCKFSGSPGDYDIIESFGRLTHANLLKLGLKSIAAVGQIGFPEKAAEDYTTYSEFKIDPADVMKFDFTGKDLPIDRTFQIVFALFDFFGLKEEFKISNQKLYSFLNRISARYRSEFYFNWNHAVEVCQFCAYQLSLITVTIPKSEILTLLVAALCHDIDHDGFSDMGAIDSLYQSQSIYESHHIGVSAVYVSDLAVFHENPSMWELFIDLVLATDMSKHFTILHGLSEKTVDFADRAFRQTFLQLLLKAADVSDCCRRWENANTYRVAACEEFFQTGFLDGVEGLVFEGDRRDRSELVRAQSFIGVYQDVCHPLFSELDKLCEPLLENTATLEVNIRSWKKERDGSSSDEDGETQA
jgi:GAF domain-containing protein